MIILQIRLLMAFAAVLMARGSAVAQLPQAQLPQAPPPHPPFRELVKEYQRLGLPLPPPDAELVRIEFWRLSAAIDTDDQPHESYLIGFRLAPPRPGADPRYLIGAGEILTTTEWFDPQGVKPAKPTPDALRLVDMDGKEYVSFAVQCELRGWHDLAQAAYARAIEQWYSEPPQEVSFLDELRSTVIWLWERRLEQRGTDRKEILRHLKALYGVEETPETRLYGLNLLRRLERTVNQPRAKPGTVEARIDDLTEYFVNPQDWTTLDRPPPPYREPYWKLAELGFDAVPALIDHIRDDRLTRAVSFGGFSFFGEASPTVGDLCSRLLSDFSGGTIARRGEGRGNDLLDAEQARKWFAEAKKIGEEKWLLDHAIPKGDMPSANRVIVRAIGAKYPARLPEIYRAVLQKPPVHVLDEPRDCVEEVVASKLPREQKIALLEEGVAHKVSEHRLWALEGLASLDADLFRKRLAEDLKKYPGDALEATSLIQRTDDPGCWDAFAAAAKRASYEARMVIILDIGHLDPPDKPDPIRRERVRFLAQLLDDRTAEKDESGDTVEVRDYAASQLGGLLRFRMDYRYPDHMVQHDPNRGPITRFVFREAVRRAAEQELTRRKK